MMFVVIYLLLILFTNFTEKHTLMPMMNQLYMINQLHLYMKMRSVVTLMEVSNPKVEYSATRSDTQYYNNSIIMILSSLY